MGSSLCVAIAKDKIRKTKKKEMIQTMALPDITEEVLIDILIRLPAKSLMRFKCVSKLWLSLIISRYFTNLYPKSSSSRQRLLTYIVDENKQSHSALLKSSSSSHDHSVSAFDQDLTMPRGMEGGYFVSAVRGFVCLRMGRMIRICNLNTRQVVKLPIIRSEVKEYNNVWNYFGYDSVHDEYKVLSLVWEVNNEERVVRSDYQVLVLGAGASWEKTQCHIPHKPHCPSLPGMAINGVLYYRAWTDVHRCVIMSFDLSSQELNLIELPNEVRILRMSSTVVMNYKEKLAVFEYSNVLRDSILNVWVLEDADKSRWSDKKTFVLPVSQMSFVTRDGLVMAGSSRSSEVLLARATLQWDKPIRVFMYHLERNEITQRVEISPSLFGSLKMAKIFLSPFWDYISIMYLKI